MKNEETSGSKKIDTIKKIYSLEEDISKNKKILAISALTFGVGVIALILGKDAIIKYFHLHDGSLDVSVQEAAQIELAGSRAHIIPVITIPTSPFGIYIGGKSYLEDIQELRYYKKVLKEIEEEERTKKLEEADKGISLKKVKK